MNHYMSGQKPFSQDHIQLFVYGTLRRGGVAYHYLQDYPLLKSGFPLPGYALYDAGWYPFAVPSSTGSVIVGDVVKVPLDVLPRLDAYEGSGYVRHSLHDSKLLLYLKKDSQVEGYPLVEGGDWLAYLANHRK